MPTYTASQLAETVGIAESDTRRFFRALGFPDSGDDIRYTEDDRRVLSTLVETLAGSEVDLATGVRLVRAVGQNVARMADWQVAALASLAEENPSSGASKREVTERIAGGVAEAMELALSHAWRRHLGAAIDRIDVDEGMEDPDEASCVTVGFADLVNFTALSNEMDSDRLGELVEIFEARSGDVVAAHEGRMIKTIGDAVLFVADEADQAMDIACGFIDVIGEDSRLPDVRIGLATGLVVTRLGDVFGPPVNLAARLTALARRNRVIVDDATVEALVQPGYEMRRLTARPLRGFGLVEPVSIRRC